MYERTGIYIYIYICCGGTQQDVCAATQSVAIQKKKKNK
jgi:hypothetical protein